MREPEPGVGKLFGRLLQCFAFLLLVSLLGTNLRWDAAPWRKPGTIVPEGGEHPNVFPPFDPGTFLSQLVWLAVTFGLRYVAMKWAILPRLAQALSE